MKCPLCKKDITYLRTDEDLELFEKAEKWWNTLNPTVQLDYISFVYSMKYEKGKVRK